MSLKIWGCCLWSRSMVLGSAERGKTRQISREIISQEFQHVWLRYLNLTECPSVRLSVCPCHRQTDGPTDNLPWQYRTLRSIASRGKTERDIQINKK